MWSLIHEGPPTLQLTDEDLRNSAAAKLLQPCPTLYDPMDSSPPGSAIPGILQARTLEWFAISFSSARKWKGNEREVAQSCPTLHDTMGCSLPGSSVNRIFQARVLEWGAIAFSACTVGLPLLFWGGVAPSYATLYDSAPWPRSTPRREALYLMYPHISKSQSFQMFQKPPGCQVKLLILDPLSQIIWCAGLEGARESPFNEYSSSLGISMQLVSGYSHGLHMVFLYEDQSLDLGSILIRYKLILKNYICKHYCK